MSDPVDKIAVVQAQMQQRTRCGPESHISETSSDSGTAFQKQCCRIQSETARVGSDTSLLRCRKLFSVKKSGAAQETTF